LRTSGTGARCSRPNAKSFGLRLSRPCAISWHAGPARSPDCEILESDHSCPCALIAGASLGSVFPLLGGEVLLGVVYVVLGYSLFRWVERQAKRSGKLEEF